MSLFYEGMKEMQQRLFLFNILHYVRTCFRMSVISIAHNFISEINEKAVSNKQHNEN